MLRNNRRDVAGNRILPPREEKNADENMTIKVLGNGEFDVGGTGIKFDRNDDGESRMRRKGGRQMGGEDDAKCTFTSSTGLRS